MRAFVGRVGKGCPSGELEAAGAHLLGPGRGIWAWPIPVELMELLGDDLEADPDLANDLAKFVRSIAKRSPLPASCTATCMYVSLSEFQQAFCFVENGGLVDWLVTEYDGRPPTELALNIGLRRLGVDRGDAPDEATALGIGAIWTA